MPRTKVVDRPPVEILLDDGGTDVRSARHRWSVSELFSDRTHYGGHGTLRLGFGLRGTALGQIDRGRERPAPRAEVLRRELLAQVFLHVLVQLAGGQGVDLVTGAVAEETRAAFE